MDITNLTATARVRIRRPPPEVFAAFADSDAMSKFWFTRRDQGLREGESSTWFVGPGADAYSFEVRVTEIDEPKRISIEWDQDDGSVTEVTWSFEGTQEGETLLTVEESGFEGSMEQVVARALDSTGGFNQVVIAAKALIEHRISMNVVADHA